MTHVMRWALIGNTCVWSNMCTSCVHHSVYVHIYVYFVCVMSTMSFWCIVYSKFSHLRHSSPPTNVYMYILDLHLYKRRLLAGHFCLYTCTYSWSLPVLCCSLLVLLMTIGLGPRPSLCMYSGSLPLYSATCIKWVSRQAASAYHTW